MEQIKYITENENDHRWGLIVCSAGRQRVAPHEEYPPQGHNAEYTFDWRKGRTLQEYQLLYISEGEGTLETRSAGRHTVKAGDMFLIFPSEWHTYRPNPETGWREHWIGFKGENIDNRVTAGFFSRKQPLYHIGTNDTIESLYREATDVAVAQRPFFQQLLAGIVNHLLGLMFMTEANRNLLPNSDMPNIIELARQYMQRSITSDITMPDVARHFNISYSTFRHIFKRYTGLAPADYFINLKIHRAKELLRSSNIPIKEIAYELHFESPEYFATLFKRRVGMSPSHFRSK